MEETDVLDEYMVDSGREAESLFARGDDDALMRYVKPTQGDFATTVRVVIDGEYIEVPKATPKKDAQGNIVYDADGNQIPRYTTIYDAAMMLADNPDSKVDRREVQRRIPILCHQEHLNPIAVCRMCSVQVSKPKRGKFTADRKLVPACQHRVEDQMAVFTQSGPTDVAAFRKVLAEKFKIDEKELPRDEDIRKYTSLVRSSTQFIGELLVADHLPESAKNDGRFRNELDVVAQQLGVAEVTRCSHRPTGTEGRNFDLHHNSRPLPGKNGVAAESDGELPYSSRSFQVDHDRCILCDRCARSCSEVKPFKVIGHTGKGYKARISFDLDRVMNESSCVQCGECMTACPTGAITLNRRVVPRALRDEFNVHDIRNPLLKQLEDPFQPLPKPKGRKTFLSANELLEIELKYDDNGVERSFFPFRDMPYSYLKWNEGAVCRRELKDGEEFIKEGEFGSTAFLLLEGEFKGVQTKDDSDEGDDGQTPRGFLSFLKRVAKRKGSFHDEFTILARRDLILGEIACLTNTRRKASVSAKGPAVVLEVTRNMLEMLQRIPSARRVLDGIYSRRAIRACLINSDLFQGLQSKERKLVVAEFQKAAKVQRLRAGQAIVKEGARVGFDAKGNFLGDFYIVLQGFVKVSRQQGGQERVLRDLGPGDYFGEIALLPDHSTVQKAIREYGINPGIRTATVVALADVEIVSVPGLTFRRFFKPEKNADRNDPFAQIAERIAERTVGSLRQLTAPPPLEEDRMGEYLRQGLYQGQKMLVLDLLTCTRCDECTKACADAHGDGHSRLLREGLRFGDFLVAASCRSCHQPYCMEGCPVDAIHRDRDSLEILIENHCIGCSLCERSCPYGSIQMVPDPERFPKARWSDFLPQTPDKIAPAMTARVKRKAVNCDLCHDLVGPGRDPFCVSACPHTAAFRMSGEQLMAEVARRGSKVEANAVDD